MHTRNSDDRYFRNLVREIMNCKPEVIRNVVIPRLELYERFAKADPYSAFIIVKYNGIQSIPVGLLIEPFTKGDYTMEAFDDEEIFDIYPDDLLDNIEEDEDELEDTDVINEDEEDDEFFDKYAYMDEEIWDEN